ncbi:MAG: hemerythrin domain-containing protein [Bacilli bacterium]
MEHSPIKRHPSLQPLSRHHFHGLVIAQNLLRAGTEPDSLAIMDVRSDLAEFWSSGGRDHFREEEEILLPVYSRYAPLDRPEISEMLLEHIRIRSLVDQIVTRQVESEAVMHELGVLLRDHIRKEERVIFPLIEAALPTDELERLATQLAAPAPIPRQSFHRP